jgi:hypothetical protein
MAPKLRFATQALGAAPAKSTAPPSIRLRRLFTYRPKGSTQVEKRGAIQVQRCHGGPADGGASLDEQEIRVPSEMTRPLLLARVKQGKEPPALRIASAGFCNNVGLT